MNTDIRLVDRRVLEVGDPPRADVVEFFTSDNTTIRVMLPPKAKVESADPYTRALERMRTVLNEPTVQRAVRDDQVSAREKQDKKQLEEQLQEGLESSFPASDPISTVTTTTLPTRREP